MQNNTRSPAELRNMFGANLRILSTGYRSISELTRQLGINRTQFNRYLSGESFPRPDVLDRICKFFGVDARILLEPVAATGPKESVLNGPYLADFIGKGVNDIPEDFFPSGFYRFSRRSFVDEKQFIVGLVYVSRQNGIAYIKGYEAAEALQAQGLPVDRQSREFRGYVARQEDGITMVIARRGSMTCSFNFLARVASFQNNFWVGYVTRTVRENTAGNRVTRMVYEFLGGEISNALAAARKTGFQRVDDLLPFHRQLLTPDDPFR